MRETEIEKAVCRWAEARGWMVRKIVYQGRKNAPDRLFIKDGRHVWIEFKRPNETARVAQHREHEHFRRAGVTVHVVDNAEDAYAILRSE